MSSRTLPDNTTLMFQLKGGMYPLIALQLLGTDLSLFEDQLQAKIAQAPKFFANTPIVIDLQKFYPATAVIDFKKLVKILLHKKLVPVGIRGGLVEQQAAAGLAGLPTIAVQANDKDPENPAHPLDTASTPHSTTNSAEKEASEVQCGRSKIITEPVRSGQQIYARDGDLIVLAPVSHGSELLADGNIHVYGPLRGRALAGITGDETAHIFCNSLEAELISIAGQYKISEDVDQALWRLAVDISMDNGRLHIRLL